MKTVKNIKNPRKANTNTQQLLEIIADSMLDKKAEDVVSLDLTNLHDAMADYFVICEANSPPQMRAIADNIVEKVKKLTGIFPNAQEGQNSTEWVLIDYLDIVVHIFHQSKRHVYQLEQLWGDAAIITSYQPDGSRYVKHYHQTIIPKAE